MTYDIEIRETLSRTIKVDAGSIDDAIKAVRLQYLNEEIVLDSEDFAGVEYIVNDEDGEY